MNTCKGYDRFCIEEEKAKEQQEKMRREVRARNKKHRKYIQLQEQSLKGLEEEMAEFRAKDPRTGERPPGESGLSKFCRDRVDVQQMAGRSSNN